MVLFCKKGKMPNVVHISGANIITTDIRHYTGRGSAASHKHIASSYVALLEIGIDILS